MHAQVKHSFSRIIGVGLAALLFALALPGTASAAGSLQVTGTVTNQAGGGVFNVSVTATDPGGTTVQFGPSFTAADGAYQLALDPGTYDIHFVPPGGGGLNSVVFSNFTVSTDQVLSVQLTPSTHTFSGVVRDSNSQPLAGWVVEIATADFSHWANATSNAAGQFSMNAVPGVYHLNDIHAPTDRWTAANSGDPATTIDLTTGNASQDIQVNETTLAVAVLDANGNPIPGTAVFTTSSGGQISTQLLPGETGPLFTGYYTREATTNSAGIATLTVPKTTTYAPGILCAAIPGHPHACSTTTITVNAPTTIVFQPQPDPVIPDAPTELSGVTPTRDAPALTWNPASGAATYRVFRDGLQVGTTVDPNFTDAALSVSGSYSYTVVAVSANTVAGPSSAPFVVVYDTEAPVLGTASWSVNPKPVGNSTTTLSVPAADGLSGVAGGEYFVGGDPGVGTATTMSLGAGSLSASLGAGLAAGVYDVGVRARDSAGNWSPVSTTMLVVYDPSIQGVTGKNQQGFVPVFGSDMLPGLMSAGQADKADYGFTVDWLAGGAIDPNSDFHVTYTTGSQCNSPHPQNCHSFRLDAMSFSQLVIDQTNNSRARFQGIASIQVDGVFTSNPFTVEGIDGDRLTPAVNDHFLLKIYAEGADPATATPLYQVSVSLPHGNAVKVR